MELKTFKTYLSEQEKLDEFVGAVLPALTRVGSAVATRAAGLLGRRGLQKAALAGAAEAGANKLLGNNSRIPTSGGEEGMPMDIPMVEPRTSVNTRNMQSSGAAPQAVGSINPASRQQIQFSGSTNPTLFQLMYGGLRAKLGRM